MLIISLILVLSLPSVSGLNRRDQPVYGNPAPCPIRSAIQSFHTAATPPSVEGTSPGSIDGEMTTPSVHSHTVQSIPAVAKGSSATPQPSSGTIELSLELPNRKGIPKTNTSTNELHLKLHESKATPAYDTSTSMPSLPIETQPSLIFGMRTISSNTESQYILPTSQILSLGSIVTASTANLALQPSGTQALLVSGSSTSLLSSTTSTMPEASKKASPPTISSQTIQAVSLSQYSIDGQTLTPSGVNTFSGTAIALASSASGTTVKNGPKASSSTTTQVGSISNGTEVQNFTANALGVRDELWRSLMVLLTGTALLLWL